MKQKNKLKSGFTLMEVMILLVFVSLVIAASTPLITKKIKGLPARVHHGRFVCYADGSYRYYNASGNVISSGTGGCKFTPPARAAVYKIELVGAGAGGYNYYEIYDASSEKTGGYNLQGGSTGEGITDFEDSALYNYFGGFTKDDGTIIPRAYFGYLAKSGVNATDGEDYTEYQNEALTSIKSDNLTGFSDGWIDPYLDSSDEHSMYGIWYNSDYSGYANTAQARYNELITNGSLSSSMLDLPYWQYVYVRNEGEGSSSRVQHASDEQTRQSRVASLVNVAQGKARDKAESLYNSYCDNKGSNEGCIVLGSNYNLKQIQYAINSNAVSYYGIFTPEPLEDFDKYLWNVDIRVSEYATETGIIGKGGNGGIAGEGLYMTGPIDFINHSNETQIAADSSSSYLQSLFNGNNAYIRSIYTTTAGTCDGGYRSNARETSPRADTNDQETMKSNYSLLFGENGKNVKYYDGIYFWNKCATYASKPTGGDGGYIKQIRDSGNSNDEYDYWLYSISAADGESPDGTIVSGISLPAGYSLKSKENLGDQTISDNVLPELNTATTLNTRYHKVGQGGGAGEYVVRYATSLSDDCVFSVGSGGPASNVSPSDEILAAMDTTLTCNDGTLSITASGGSYNISTNTKEYSGFDYLNAYGEIEYLPAEGFFTESLGASSESPVDVYTKYKFEGGTGAGGDGTFISDQCTQPYGEYSITRTDLNYSNLSIARGDYERPDCISDTGVVSQDSYEISDAKSGENGIIIISW